ncbi:nucleotide pyrophosphohydrolase [Actinocorallia sp. API 0066]|uniref:nucleotide pyrophosphohydrolase n=1 Tax=Actinocorallia sp. API 0066 TaxID=2896846 RepID=UPI001E563844|nr:nucleotide pyrophosphohydrolase [Actinocorallia sp. API 0066]MCD0448034.1 nucleotide pyrophosphohydrolase [Actinocorallia sp. API 0066]
MVEGMDGLVGRLREVVGERGWARYHTPKNLVMALAGEVGELVAEFQWLTEEESVGVMAREEKAAAVRSELADVFTYLVELADVLGVDLVRAAHEKADVVAERYARGEYAEFDQP